jgi:hypothetical protein
MCPTAICTTVRQWASAETGSGSRKPDRTIKAVAAAPIKHPATVARTIGRVEACTGVSFDGTRGGTFETAR